MKSSDWFDDCPVIGTWSPREAAAKLREIDDEQTATLLESLPERETPTAQPATFGMLDRFFNRPWQHAAHVFGYLAPRTGQQAAPLIHAGEVPPDESLRKSRVKVTLDALRVAGYPGFGDHRILFDFYAQNQLHRQVEHVHYNLTFRVREGERAGIIGYPIFIGLNVGSEGLSFRCFTVNVKNDDDEKLLSFLESDVLKSGLKLATTVQPAIATVSGLAIGLTKSIARRNRNIPVQDINMGLDFSRIETRARLAEGSYIVVQVPERLQKVWEWSDWVYDSASGQVVAADDADRLVPYNYIILGVSRYTGE